MSLPFLNLISDITFPLENARYVASEPLQRRWTLHGLDRTKLYSVPEAAPAVPPLGMLTL